MHDGLHSVVVTDDGEGETSAPRAFTDSGLVPLHP